MDNFKEDIKSIIGWSLKEMHMHSEDAAALIYSTGMAESGYRHLSQTGDGPAIGFFQVEPATARDIIDNYVKYRKPILNSLQNLGYKENGLLYRIKSNIALQVAFCRLKYRRDPFPLPKWNDLEDQASYWKRVYNTEKGKGTVSHFLISNGENV